MLEGKTDLAIEKVSQWNKMHPYNPMTSDTIGFRSVYQRALAKNMKKIKENMPSPQTSNLSV